MIVIFVAASSLALSDEVSTGCSSFLVFAFAFLVVWSLSENN